MIKQRFKKIVSLLSVVAASSLTATSFFVLNNNNLVSSTYQKSTDLQDETGSGNLATNYSNDSLAFKDDTYSEPNTPIGYLQTSQGYVYLVSWFGNEMWKYNVAESPFLKQAITGNTTITISKLNVIYLSNYDRVLVYGVINSNISFVFQLNNDDGSEYYVNSSSSNKVKESSLISTLNSNVIGSLNLVNLLSSNSAIMMPEGFTGSKMVCTRFSLDNYTVVPVVYNIPELSSNSNLTGITLGEVFGLMTNDTNTYIALKGYTTETNSSKVVKLVIIKLINNSFSFASTWLFTPISADNTSSFDLSNAYFTFKTIFTSNGPKAYVAMLKEDGSSTSYATDSANGNSSRLIYIDPTKENSNTSKDSTITTNDFKTNYQYYITEIYLNPDKTKAYLLLRSKTDYSKYYLFDTTSSAKSFTSSDLFSVPGLTSNSRGTFNLRIIFDSNSSSTTSITAIASIYSYNSDVETKAIKSISLKKSSESETQYTLTTSDWNATQISSFTDLPTTFSKYLPQDMTLEFLNKYIYLKKIDSNSSSGSSDNNKLYDSTLSTNNTNYITYDNAKGTVKGSVNLNLKKWWVDSSSSSSTDSIVVPINLSGFATTSDLSFSLVKSSDDDSTKWNAILSLEKSNFPSAITKEQILNNFIKQGSKVGITTNDITVIDSTNSSSATPTATPIMVYANDNDGTLKITYDLTSKSISPSITEKSGEYTYYNFKSKNAYAQISLNESAWQSLKKSKAVFQVTKEDIISCLNLTSGYKTNPEYWTWTPTNSKTTSKTNYINDCIEGNLTGTIKYDTTKDSDATTVTGNIGTVTISSDKGNGFITLLTLLGSNNTTSVYYNDAQASKIASSYSYEKVLTEFDNILASSLLFYNNWTTSEYVTYDISSSTNNKITFTLKFKDNITTSIKDGDGNNLVLDNSWITAINNKSNVLKFASSLTFDYDLTNIVYSYGLSLDNNEITIDDLVKDISNDNKLLEKYSSMLPYQFVESFYDSQKGSYDGFESVFNIIEIPSNSSAVNYYTVTSVQMVADDTNGTVTVFYTVSFPNSGSVVGSSSTASVVISGFKSTTAVANMWTVICASVGGVIGFVTICLLCYFLITKFKYSRNRSKYGSGSTESDLNLETVNYRKNIYDNKTTLKLRNTINKNTLAQRNNKKIRQGIRNYNKLQKEIGKKH